MDPKPARSARAVAAVFGSALLVMLSNGCSDSTSPTTSTIGPTAGSPGNAGPSAPPNAPTTSTPSGVYTQRGGTVTQSSRTYNATTTDTSAVYVTTAGTFTLTDSTITTSGNSSSLDNSSFYGLNAAVLAEVGSRITLSTCTISTTGSGANGAFATGTGSSVVLSDVTIDATAQGGHAVTATLGGSVTATDVNMTTAGANSGAIATDRGGGTITVRGGTVMTSGQDSPGIYSTGNISVSDATISASGAEAAVIEGADTITLTNTSLLSTKQKWGVMLYQSMSGDAQGTRGTFTMAGGSLSYLPTSGPLFYVTNTTGIITLARVEVTTNSATILKASAGNWGSSGGTAVLTASDQTLTGDIVGDSVSSVTATLQNASSLTGAINSNAATTVNLTLDSSSAWTVTGDSYLTTLADPGGISGSSITNIIGNGHTVYYDSSTSSQLGGLTYSLVNGGRLTPR